MNGVFNYNLQQYPRTYSLPQKGIVSWSGVLVAMAISLCIVAGVSFTLNILTQKITADKMPDSDGLVSSWLAQAVIVHPVHASTQYSNLDRSAYYNSNKSAYTGTNHNIFTIKSKNISTITSKKATTTTSSNTTKNTVIVSTLSTSNASGISATRLIQSATTMSLVKKGTTTFSIGFKNTGSAVWPSAGIALRSAATKGSYFSHSSWTTNTVVKDVIPSAKPGELVYVSFTLEAPNTNGIFSDTFYLTYNGNKVAGTDTTLSIAVVNGNADTQISSKNASSVIPVVTPVISQDIPSISESGTFNAVKLIQSSTVLAVGQLQSTDFQIGWKNTGTATWKVGGDPIRLRSSARKESYFHHVTWDDGVWVTTLKTDVKPGEVVYTSFKIEAPSVMGNYNESFTLYHGNTPLALASVTLPIQVVKGAPKVQIAQETPSLPTTNTTITNPSATNTSTNTQQAVVTNINESEPLIRVGVFNSREPIKVTANKAFEARDAQGQVLASLQAGMIATVSFDFTQKIYTLATDTATLTSSSYIRFVGMGSPTTGNPDQDTVFEIVSYIDHPGWSATLNDNRFRSAVEIRYSSSKDRVWLINELSLDSYLKGLGETSNSSPYEFQKSLITAARTYAHIVMGTNKYPGENFHVRNTDADQVYRGYSSEIRMPQFARAVDETKGVVVTYNGSIVVTPYFSNSDGRTRSWEEVWAGSPKPWLKSVDDPYNAGMKLWGHGVGMSASGAVSMAVAGNTFDQILKHYYTDIQLMKVY